MDNNNVSSFKDKTLDLVIVLSGTPWEEAPRMRHHITDQLLRWYNVLYVEYYPYGFICPTQINRLNDRLTTVKLGREKNVIPQLYANLPIFHHHVNLRACRKIKSLLKEFEWSNLILFNFLYDFYEICDFIKFDFSCYICYDDFPNMRRTVKPKNIFISSFQRFIWQSFENKVLKRVDAVFTPHIKLYYRCKKLNESVHMLYHAHTFKSKISANVDRLNNENCLIKVGFLGYIHYRLNTSILDKIIDDQSLELNLAGPVALDMVKFIKNNELKIRLWGNLAESQIPDFLDKMDVLIIPYYNHLPENVALTTTSKLFQYIHSLKPIVITNLKNFIDLPKGVLYKSESDEEFIENIKIAFKEDNNIQRFIRKKIADQNTWDSRGEEIRSVISSHLTNH